ncbi:MAG: hypothetical protein MJ138_03695 [Kiritimatiellae bacterium]|nr:hypothetical protein [Kiritimatiellia bacterium]
MFTRWILLAAAFSCVRIALSQDAAEAAAPETDGEAWNRGVEAYRAGDVTNALEILRPLVLSRTHGPRAAEVAGAIAYGQGDLENAARDMQIALRANPDDARANRNFTRAADKLPELREQKHLEEVMQSLGKQSPDALLGDAAKNCRAIMKEFPEALTNDAVRAVAMCEALAARAEKMADTWIPVKTAIAQSVTNEQQAMTITAQVEEGRAATLKAAEALADLNYDGAADLAKSEEVFTRFWKLTAMPPAACAEDVSCQTNAYANAEKVNGRDWQREALDFTRQFRRAFPAWAQQYEQQAQADTNKPPFTAEAQAEVSALSTEVEKLQIELAEDASGDAAARGAKQLDVLKKLHRIQELLPNDGKGGGQNQQKDKQQNQPQNQPQNQQDQQNQQEQKDGAEEEQQPKEDQDVEDVLRKAQERSDEHENEKKARMRNVPLPPNERDW